MCTSRPQSSLFKLPAEIIVKIFDYLNPPDLVSIRQLNNRRLTDISLTMKCANFSVCNTVQMEDVSAFFTEDRVLHIQEIKFDNSYFVSSHILEKYIVKCKNLRKLSVLGCGLSYTKIVSILENCEELEELHWNLVGILSEAELSLLDREGKKPLKLKEISFYAKDIYCRDLIILDILQRSANLIIVCWNGIYYFTTLLSINEIRKLFMVNLDFRMTLVFIGDDLKYLRNRIVVPFFVFKVPEANQGLEDPSLTSIQNLQYRTELHVMALQTLPSNSVKTVTLIMFDGQLRIEKYIEQIQRITGHKLLHLAVRNKRKPSRNEKDRKLVFRIQRKLLNEMTSTCINIQSLNLSDLHFDKKFCFNSLCHLTNLKALMIPPCTLKTGFTDSSDYCVNAAKLQVQDFKNFVFQCKNVESFSLFGCSQCNHGPLDEDIMALAMWPKLTHLFIGCVRSLRCCPFLAQVADSCPKFAGLELVDVGLEDECHFLPNVFQVLQNSKSLQFLRINQGVFNPDSPLFWSNLALAQNLLGLCLSSNFNRELKYRIILDALIKLPYLHLFHLHLRRIPSNLTHQVNEIMRKNGMEVCWIDVSLREPSQRLMCLDNHFL